jgi:hypothetical protein
MFTVCSNVSGSRGRSLCVCGLYQVYVRTMTDRWWDMLLGRDQHLKKKHKLRSDFEQIILGYC